MSNPGKGEATVSVVICTKDRLEEPVTCVESVLRQTRLPDEIVVVDAPGSDVLKERLRDVSAASSVRLVYERASAGLTHQRNVGAHIARGEIVFFLDDDLVLEPEFVAEILRVFESDANAEIGGVMGRITNLRRTRWLYDAFCGLFSLGTYGDGQFRRSGLGTFPFRVNGGVSQTEFLSGGLTAYHRRVLNDLSWDERLEGYGLMEDDDFSYRVSRRYRNYYVPSARCIHLQSETARDGLAKYRQMWFKNHRHLFEKNMPKTLRTKAAYVLSVVGVTILFAYGMVIRWIRCRLQNKQDVVQS